MTSECRKMRIVCALCVVVGVTFFAPYGKASPPSTFEFESEVLAAADMSEIAGVVEYTKAGVFVAEVVLVDSFREDSQGNLFVTQDRIATASGTLSLHLKGERAIAFLRRSGAGRSVAPTLAPSHSRIGDWSLIYATPVLSRSFLGVAPPHGDLVAAVRAFVRLPYRQRRQEFIVAGLAHYSATAEDKVLREQLLAVETLGDAQMLLVEAIARQHTRNLFLENLVISVADDELLKLIQRQGNKLFGKTGERDRLLARVASVVGSFDQRRGLPLFEGDSPALGKDISDFRELAKKGYDEASDYLLKKAAESADSLPYYLSVSFASACDLACDRYYRKWLASSNAWLQSAGAVLLAAGGAPDGNKLLQQAAKSAGLPGVWAAVTLARMGVKDAMNRATQVFYDTWGDPVLADYFQKQLIAVISNGAEKTAAHRFVDAWNMYPIDRFHEIVLKYWVEHRQEMALSDPWLQKCFSVGTD